MVRPAVIPALGVMAPFFVQVSIIKRYLKDLERPRTMMASGNLVLCFLRMSILASVILFVKSRIVASSIKLVRSW